MVRSQLSLSLFSFSWIGEIFRRNCQFVSAILKWYSFLRITSRVLVVENDFWSCTRPYCMDHTYYFDVKCQNFRYFSPKNIYDQKRSLTAGTLVMFLEYLLWHCGVQNEKKNIISPSKRPKIGVFLIKDSVPT